MSTKHADDHDPITPEAIEAEAQRLYGEDRYAALHDEHVKDAYRKRARQILEAARDAGRRDG